METSGTDTKSSFILLKVLGSLVFFIGLSDWILHTHIVPQALSLANYQILLIIIGLCLMYPHKSVSFNYLTDHGIEQTKE